jgi:DinB superfamily
MRTYYREAVGASIYLEGKLPKGAFAMPRLQIALEQIVFARNYTLRLLDQTKEADWFRMPPGGVSHVAWQVGHLAMAQYRLALDRIRGPAPDDANMISDAFLLLFSRQSMPDADADKYPSPAEIRAVFNRVHEGVIREVGTLAECELDKPPLKAHPLAKTKMESLIWCAHHEMLHAGQIGLLRRQLGYPPLW